MLLLRCTLNTVIDAKILLNKALVYALTSYLDFFLKIINLSICLRKNKIKYFSIY
jgi:hypothetical protein